jgi:predicted dehydrogenase/threonine dehydrogenase-like Zn-dependent dehydrogenase
VKQLVQPASGGPVQLIDVPRPSIGPTEVLVQTVASVISPGTERAVTALAQSNLLAKARARPDLVRQVVKKARTEGISATARTVRTRLAADVPLGYSAAGIAVEVGEHVAGVSPGQLVATGGAGKANHAEFQAVPGLLCAPVPDGVDAESAAFATIASIALHGLRLTEVGTGGKVVVVGLGLVGQLTVRLAEAAGCDVAGIDLEDFAVERVRAGGALGLVESGEATTSAVLEWSRGRGADAVVLAAAGGGSEAIRRTPALCRDRATVVVVGDVGLSLERAPFYDKELAVRFARSYGPGRYERSYEEWGVDYPAGHVRWTEGRNMEAILDLLASGRLRVEDLITHRFDLASSPDASELIEARSEPYLGIALTYPALPPPERPIQVNPARQAGGGLGVGFIGAGAFASSVLVPAFRRAGFSKFCSVASASGLSARRLAERAGFEKAVSGAEAVIDDPDVDVVVIATPHDSHAALAARALRAGKHVFCEKPLALTEEELDDVEAAWRASGRVLFVGFNRRWSEPVRAVQEHFAESAGPLVVTYRVSAGAVPDDHWYHDRRQGGRLLGEVCHFIDTCGAIVDSAPESVSTLAGARRELALADDLAVTLAYPGGSLAAITYASGGHHSVEKERIEVLGRGRSAVLVDFREVLLDGKTVRLTRQDKGHQNLVAAFRQAIEGGADVAPTAFASSRATLDAAAAFGRSGQL